MRGEAVSLPSLSLGPTMAQMVTSPNAGREQVKVAIVTGESDHIVAEVAARIFADLADPQAINQAKDGAWKAPFWRALSDAT